MSRVSLAGINGERADAIRRVLGGGRMTAYTIVEAIRQNGDEHLLRTFGHVEAIQAVLRELERRGEVYRVRDRIDPRLRLEDWWGLR